MSELLPSNTDAILGGQTPPPVNAAVLGGVAGAKQQIAREWGLSDGLVTCARFETVFVNDNAEIIEQQQKEVFCYTVDINGVSLEMVYVPAGNFAMGGIPHSGNQPAYQLVQPIHLVTLESFFIGKYHVTQKQYLALMGTNPAYFKGNDRHPVEEVSWQDAMEFCRRLSELTNKNFTLPSESQWEYACRAGTDTNFYFGREINSELVNFDNLTNDKYARGRSICRTTPVGIYPPNSWCLYDMHGNVRDWCLDTYHHGYIGAPSDGSAWLEVDRNDYNNRDSWNYHSFRGGSWNDTGEMCASYQRGFIANNSHTRQNGFRVCMVLNSDARSDILPPIQINGNYEDYEEYEEE